MRFPKPIAAFDDSGEIEPAYTKPHIIDHLGIQPPEQVKKSVLEALVPLTEQEQQIKIRGEDDQEAIYNRSLDDGSFRLRPGQRIKSPSLSDSDDALYVPKVAHHHYYYSSLCL